MKVDTTLYLILLLQLGSLNLDVCSSAVLDMKSFQLDAAVMHYGNTWNIDIDKKE